LTGDVAARDVRVTSLRSPSNPQKGNTAIEKGCNGS